MNSLRRFLQKLVTDWVLSDGELLRMSGSLETGNTEDLRKRSGKLDEKREAQREWFAKQKAKA
jgi:hypothetical protein